MTSTTRAVRHKAPPAGLARRRAKPLKPATISTRVWSSRRSFAATTVEVISNTTRCYMAINAMAPEVHYDGKRLPRYDAVIRRDSGRRHTLMAAPSFASSENHRHLLSGCQRFCRHSVQPDKLPRASGSGFEKKRHAHDRFLPPRQGHVPT